MLEIYGLATRCLCVVCLCAALKRAGWALLLCCQWLRGPVSGSGARGHTVWGWVRKGASSRGAVERIALLAHYVMHVVAGVRESLRIDNAID